jgi:pimeloyl-ACP methyl ester carboxylesterase
MGPLLLINGYAATGSDWDPVFLAELERDFELIHPDNRGTGSSRSATAGLSVELLADDMVELLERRGVERATVVGWSMGGFVAQALAAADPARVSRLVLISTDPGGPGAILAEPGVTARLFDHGGSPREQATRLLGLLFPAAIATRLDQEAGEMVASARAELKDETLFAEERAIEAWHAEPAERRLGSIESPALVIAGEVDIVIPAANAALLATALADARLRTFAGCGHACMAQEPRAIAGLIRDFAAGADLGVE